MNNIPKFFRVSITTATESEFSMEKKMKRILILTILLSILLVGCAAQPEEVVTEPIAARLQVLTTVSAEGVLLPDPQSELGFAQGGIVTELLFKEGDSVKTGDVILRLQGFENVMAELEAARAEKLLAEQALDDLFRNALESKAAAEWDLIEAQKAYESEANRWNIDEDKASDLELALNDYVQREEDYREAREDLNDLLDEDMDNRKREKAQEDLDREIPKLAEAYKYLQQDVAQFNHPLTQKQADLLYAINKLEIARELQERMDSNNLDPEVLALAEARLAAATTRVDAALSSLAAYELRAPYSGKIFSLSVEPGETALPGVPLVYLANPDAWVVETKDLAEIYIGRVQPGQKAVIALDAFPGEVFSGTVTAIDPLGREYLGDMTYRVTITLDQPDPRFLWNMTATVEIDTQ